MPKKNNNGQNPEEQNPIPQEVEKKSDLDNMFRNAEKTQRTIEDRINNCINMGVTEQISNAIERTNEDTTGIKYTFDHAKTNYLSDKTYDYQQKVLATYFNEKTMSGITDNLVNLGMMKAQICYDIGVQYQKWRNRLSKQNPDDPNLDAKAKYLAQHGNSEANLREKAFDTFQKSLSEFCAHNNLASTDYAEISADKAKNMTIGQFLDSVHMRKENMQNFLNAERKHNPELTLDTNLFDHYKRKAMSVNRIENEAGIEDKDVVKLISSDKNLQFTNCNIILGVEMVKAASGRKGQELINVGYELTSDFDNKHPAAIEEWIKTEAPNLLSQDKIKNFNTAYDNAKNALNSTAEYEIRKQYPLAMAFQLPKIGEVKYDDYMNRHIGRKVLNASPEERKVHLAKAMAANALCKSGKPFNTKSIDKLAAEFMERPAFQNLSETDTFRSLFNVKRVEECHLHVFDLTYGVRSKVQQGFIMEMTTLSENMMSSKDRTEKYQELYNAVKDIAAHQPGEKGLHEKNKRLINAIEAYTKGKKTVRHSTDGNARFDNALDALAIVDKYIPGSRNVVQAQVDRIRTVRGVEAGHKDYVDLKNFGAARARNAKLARDAEKQAKLQSKQASKGNAGLKI